MLSAPKPPAMHHLLRSHALRILIASLLLGTHLLGTPVSAPDVVGDYALTIAAAKAFAAENSWAKAREQYAAALALAPDDEAKRWCELWLVEAEFRGESTRDWSERDGWQKRHEDDFARLLTPYSKGRARDGFWRAALEARARFRGDGGWLLSDSAWQDRFAVADWLAEQPGSEEARREYFDFLRTLVGTVEQSSSYGDSVREKLILHFAQAQGAAHNDEDRVWTSWQLARFVGADAKRPLPERRRCWAEALSAARGQSVELTVRTQELLWRIGLHFGEKPADSSKPGYDAWAAQMEELRRLGVDSARPEDRSCADAIAALQRAWSQPRLALPIPERLQTGEALRLRYGACGIRRIEVAVYRQTRELIEARAKTLEETRSSDWATALGEARELVLRKTVPLPTEAPLVWQQGEIEVVANLPAGIYTVETNGHTANGTLQHSESLLVGALQAAAFRVGEGRTDLFVFDGSADQPVARREVRGLILAETGENMPLSGRTDAEGRFSLPMAPRVEPWSHRMVVAFVGGRPLICGTSEAFLSEAERYVADLFLNQPIYRPGETVRWKLVLRERRDGRFHLPRMDRPMLVSVGSDDLVIADKRPLVLDVFGAAQGEWPIPSGARPGYFRLKLEWAGEADTEVSRHNWLGFQVDNFVPPQVVGRVELASGAESLAPGKELAFDVGADYLSGGPVVGAQVACTFACGNSWETDWQRAQSEKAPWREWAEQMRKRILTGVTGAHGKARFTVQLPADLPESMGCTLEGKVMPKGMPEVEVRRSLGIARGGRYAFPTSDDGLRFCRVGESVAFSLTVNDGLQRPVPFAGTATLVERRWSELWRSPDGRIVNERHIGAERRALKLSWGEAMPDGWTQLHAGFNEKPVAEQSVRADSSGIVVPKFRIPRSGLFCVRLKCEVGELPVLGVEQFGATVLVPDEDMTTPALPPGLAAIALPSQVTRDGPFVALAVLPEGTGTGWLTLRGEDEAKCLRLSTRQRAAWARSERLPRMNSRTAVELSVPQNDSLRNETRWLNLPDPALEFCVQVEPQPAVARPGEVATLRIHGNGTAQPGASVAVAAWDEALTQLTGWRSERPEFLTRRTTPFESQGRILGEVDRYRSKSAGDPRLVIGALSELAKAGAAMRNLPASTGSDEEVVDLVPFVVSASEDRGYRASSTLAGTRIRTELRDVAPPMAAAGTAQNAPRIEIRRHFVSTAFWAPSVITDAKGEATVTFKYPDNLTQWRIEAYAVGADGNSFGTATAFTRTSLPFQARLNLPRFLVAGDLAEAGATLVNRTDVPRGLESDTARIRTPTRMLVGI